MAIRGGLCVPSTSMEPRRRAPSTVKRGLKIRCSCVGGTGRRAAGGLADEHYRTLRLTPGATKADVKRAFRHLALQYHPDVRKHDDDGHDFQRISLAYQALMSGMAEAEERLEYWRLRYGLTDQELDKYRHYINDDDDDWFDV